LAAKLQRALRVAGLGGAESAAVAIDLESGEVLLDRKSVV